MQDYNKDAHGIYISTRQLSYLIAGGAGICSVIFLIGYFWGYKQSSEYFTNKLEEGSLADQVCSSMYALYDKGRALSDDDQDDDVVQETVAEMTDQEEHSGDATLIADSPAPPVTVSAVPVAKEKYQAQLAGFGSHKAAIACATKLQTAGHAVQVHKRVSKTAKGKQITWYQVVTASYTNKKELEALVKKLEQEERFKDIQIVTC
jgi:hypothetical protein